MRHWVAVIPGVLVFAGLGCARPEPHTPTALTELESAPPPTDWLTRLLENPKATQAELAGFNRGKSDVIRPRAEFPDDIAEPDATEVLNAILADVVSREEQERTGDVDGEPIKLQLALVNSSDRGVAWPQWYRPFFPDCAVTQVYESAGPDSDTSTMLLVSINRFSLRETPVDPALGKTFFGAPISITVSKPGVGRTRIRRTVDYDLQRDGEHWLVKSRISFSSR